MVYTWNFLARVDIIFLMEYIKLQLFLSLISYMIRFDCLIPYECFVDGSNNVIFPSGQRRWSRRPTRVCLAPYRTWKKTKPSQSETSMSTSQMRENSKLTSSPSGGKRLQLKGTFPVSSASVASSTEQKAAFYCIWNSLLLVLEMIIFQEITYKAFGTQLFLLYSFLKSILFLKTTFFLFQFYQTSGHQSRSRRQKSQKCNLRILRWEWGSFIVLLRGLKAKDN